MYPVMQKKNPGYHPDTGMSKDDLVEEYAQNIKYIAQRLISKLPVSVEIGDLIDAGVIGLLDAVEKFDKSRGIQFKTYAEYRIRGAMLDELRRNDWLPRSVRKKSNQLGKIYKDLEKKLHRPPHAEEMAEALNMEVESYFKLLREATTGSVVQLEELGRVVEGNTGWEERLYRLVRATRQNDPFLSVQFKDMIEYISKCIDKLPDKERMVMTLYYYEELTMKEIGYILGVTESRVSQLRSQAILRLRAWMEKGDKP